MAILRRLLKINLNKIDSDFIALAKRFENNKLLFIDLGCRGENPKYWPKDSQYINIPQAEPLMEECKHFIKLINKEVQNITDGIEGRKVLGPAVLIPNE